jgi:DNA-binding NarL/FixJ family response regulator
MSTRLMIVDDHEVVRMGLRAALEVEEDFQVVAEAGNGQEAIDKALAHRPDIVLMDVRMDGLGGIEACREIRNELPDTRVLMLTSYAEEETVVSALLAGAAGYVLKNVARARLLEALRSVAKGETMLDSRLTKTVLERLTAPKPKPAADDDNLTEREREVLALIAEGATNKEIAAKLVVSENTARNHVSHILAKLGFSRRSEAAAYAVRKGMAADEGKDSR